MCYITINEFIIYIPCNISLLRRAMLTALREIVNAGALRCTSYLFIPLC